MAAAHPFLPLIAETLRATDARDVVVLGDLPWPDNAVAPERLLPETARQTTMSRVRAELAVARLHPDQDQREARQQIAALRDLLARQMLVFVPENLLEDTTLLGLGLTRQAHFEVEGSQWQAWSYDIRTYKSVPDWLNPKFWANPENWNKFRW